MVSYECKKPGCAKRTQWPDDQLGESKTCPRCGSRMRAAITDPNTEFSVVLTATRFRPASLIDSCGMGELVSLVPEPENAYDRNALKACVTREGQPACLGYVPRPENRDIRDLREQGYADIAFIDDIEETPEGKTIRVFVRMAEP